MYEVSGLNFDNVCFYHVQLYIMCLIIFEEKAEIQDQYPLSLNPVQKADDPIQDCNKSIGPESGKAAFGIATNDFSAVLTNFSQKKV